MYDTDKHKGVLMEENKTNEDGSDELESQEAEQSSNGSIDASTGNENTSEQTDDKKDKKDQNPLKGTGGVRGLVSRINIYLLAFILLVVLAGSGGGVFYFNSNKKATQEEQLKSQALSTDTLKQLSNSDVTVGDSKQVLTVQSNAIFGGSVLLKGDVEIAGKLVLGGTDLELTGLQVRGDSTLQNLNVANNLSVGSNLAVNGQVTIQDGLSVSGNTTFAGLSVSTLTVSSININSTLNLTHHIVGGGGTPSRSSGSALGSGGTTSVSGSDTAGSIRINTGGGSGAGCFVTVNFRQNYSSTPHVVVTPVGSAAGGVDYYVNRTSSGFSVCSSSNPPDHASFGFDYIIFG